MPFPFNPFEKVNPLYLNDVDDPTPGQLVAQQSGSIIPTYPGQVGGLLVLSPTMAFAKSDTAIGTLYGGVYMYVRTLSTSTAAPARGCLCVWNDLENFVVTPDIGDATALGKFAGVYINAPTKGNYCFIQVAGKATCQFVSSVTDTTDGNLVIVDQTPSNKVNAIADATAVTDKVAKSIIGVAMEATANSALKRVLLRFPLPFVCQ